MLNCSVSGLNYQYTPTSGGLSQIVQGGSTVPSYQYDYQGTGGTLWNYWYQQYYPYVIQQSYPIYIQERAMDKGKQAFEILKSLMDKNLVKLDKVKDFVEAMDTILKTL